jgi:hypothetical protein
MKEAKQYLIAIGRRDLIDQLEQVVRGNLDLFDAADLYDILFQYYSDEMPYGIQKARTGDPDQWILNRLTSTLV